MNLLIDFGAIKTGGGAQLALNFLDLLEETFDSGMTKTVILLPESGPLANFAYDTNRFKAYSYPDRYLMRFWFERTKLRHIYREHGITHIFTFFGAGLPHPKPIRSVVTTAYPIICYPDSNFWRYAPLRTRLKNTLNNQLRRRRLRLASSIVVETEVMRRRIAHHVPFDINKIFIVPPVPSRYLEIVKKEQENPDVRFLLVSGCEPHKNLWRLPEIALELKKAGLRGFQFCITTDKRLFLGQQRIQPDIWQEVEKHFAFLGKVHPRDIQTVYDAADFLINMSDLESFSNNYMEAWKAGIPLIASDRDFARSICGPSALYIEPHQPQDCAKQIAELIGDSRSQQAMIKAGAQNLARLGDDQQRLRTVMSIVAMDHASTLLPA